MNGKPAHPVAEGIERENRQLKQKFLLLKKNFRLLSTNAELLAVELQDINRERDDIEAEMDRLLKNAGYKDMLA